MDKARIERAVTELLLAMGENPEREGLAQTPQRVARMYEEIFSGWESDPKEHLFRTFTEDDHGEMVLVKDIPVYSMCEHHMMPFYGKAHVAYIPKNGVITGISKLVRVVDGYAPVSYTHLADLRFVKPLDTELLDQAARYPYVLVVEEGVATGGLASGILEYWQGAGFIPRFARLSLPDDFIPQGSLQQLRQIYGLTPERVAEIILQKQKRV